MDLPVILHNQDVWEKDLLQELCFIQPEALVWEALCAHQ